MPSLLIRHKVDIPVKPVISAPGLTFASWLPVNEPIIANLDDLTVKIHFNDKCAGLLNPDEIEQRVNVIAHFAYVDVILPDIDHKTIKLLMANELHKDGKTAILDEVGQKVYLSAVKTFNRMIQWVFSAKGQYWLEPISINTDNISSFNVETNAEAIILPEENNKWFRWDPIKIIRLKATLFKKNDPTFISKTDWSELDAFVKSNRRTSLKYDLIYRAFALNGSSLRTNALVNAVTALEISVAEFVKNPDLNNLCNTEVLSRINCQTLAGARKNMGFRCFIKYLLPLLLDEKTFKKSDFDMVYQAVEQRNNIVHRGSRDVDYDRNKQYLTAALALIKTLDELTEIAE